MYRKHHRNDNESEYLDGRVQIMPLTFRPTSSH